MYLLHSSVIISWSNDIYILLSFYHHLPYSYRMLYRIYLPKIIPNAKQTWAISLINNRYIKLGIVWFDSSAPHGLLLNSVLKGSSPFSLPSSEKFYRNLWLKGTLWYWIRTFFWLHVVGFFPDVDLANRSSRESCLLAFNSMLLPPRTHRFQLPTARDHTQVLHTKTLVFYRQNMSPQYLSVGSQTP